MAKTIESMTRNFTEAQKRRADGRPIWDEKITARRIEGATFGKNRDLFVVALEGSAWFKRAGSGDEIYDLWDEIKDSRTVKHFDNVLGAIYDLADEDRIWITFTKESN